MSITKSGIRLEDGRVVPVSTDEERRREGIEFILDWVEGMQQDVENLRWSANTIKRYIDNDIPQCHNRIVLLQQFLDTLLGRVNELKITIQRDLNGGA